MAPKELNFITSNKNKLIEVQAILGGVIDIKSKAIDVVEIQGTIEEISADKCRRAAEVVGCILYFYFWQLANFTQVQGPVLVEDTCLCFNALKELPGPYMYVYRRLAENGTLY